MNAVPDRYQRGLALLAAHLAICDDAAPTARERLEGALGEDLAQKLVSALVPHAERRGGAWRAA